MPLKKSATLKRKTKNENSELFKYIKTQIYSLIIYSSAFLSFSLISLFTDMKKDNMYYISLIMVILSNFCVSFISGLKRRKNGIMTGILSTLPMNLILILISLIFNGFKADIHTFITLAVMLLSSAVGGIISVNKKVRR